MCPSAALKARVVSGAFPMHRAPAPRHDGSMNLKRAGWLAMTVLALTIVAVSARYLTFDPATYFPEQRAIYVSREVVLGLHIGGAMVALAVGPWQFLARLRRRRPRLHRIIGVSYVAGVLVGAIGGLALATTAHGGVVAGLGFAGLGLAWLVTTGMGLRHALARDFSVHRRWMIRSFALTFAAVTLRCYLALVAVLGLDFTTSYVVIAWLCWLPNLAVAVWFTRPAAPGGRPSSAGAGSAVGGRPARTFSRA